ncbi:MAG: hypothetical protein K2K28_04410, partial [Clostridia bacterium]|nr:hypothetical protein [Clostridia bacterium]
MVPQNSVKADTSTSNIIVGEIFDDKNGKFEKSNLDELATKLIGNGSDKTLDDMIASVSSGTKNSEDFRNSAGHDVVVNFAGMEWTPTYLSLAGSKPILTLWLVNTTDVSWWSATGLDGSTPWTYGKGNVPDSNYSPLMYGTSYMRSVVLNNGGPFATNISNLETSVTKDPKNKFARFTMEQSDLGASVTSLKNYLVTPAEVEWQANQSAKTYNISYWGDGYYGDYNNESYLTDKDLHYLWSGQNFQNNAYYSVWKDDYVWLPSQTEIGWSNGTYGLWQCSMNQRSSADGTYGTWSRTDAYGDYAYISSYNTAGGAIYPQVHSGQFSVRPCINLDLSKVANNLISGVADPTIGPDKKTSAETTYNLSAPQKFTVNYDKDCLDVKITTEPSSLTSADYVFDNINSTFTPKKAGKYTLTFSLKSGLGSDIKWADSSNTDNTRTLTFTVNPLGINVPKVSVVSKEYNASGNTFALN